GESVQHRVVDRGADHLAERARPERRVVVDVAGLRSGGADEVVCPSVDREEVRSDLRLLAERGQGLGDESPGRPHLVDLGRGTKLDHCVPLFLSILTDAHSEHPPYAQTRDVRSGYVVATCVLSVAGAGGARAAAVAARRLGRVPG